MIVVTQLDDVTMGTTARKHVTEQDDHGVRDFASSSVCKDIKKSSRSKSRRTMTHWEPFAPKNATSIFPDCSLTRLLFTNRLEGLDMGMKSGIM